MTASRFGKLHSRPAVEGMGIHGPVCRPSQFAFRVSNTDRAFVIGDASGSFEQVGFWKRDQEKQQAASYEQGGLTKLTLFFPPHVAKSLLVILSFQNFSEV